MSIYTSIKDLPKTIGKTYFFETHNHNGEKGMIVRLSNISYDSYGSIYTFDYKSKANGKICYFFIASSNEPSSFLTLSDGKTWQKWTEIV